MERRDFGRERTIYRRWPRFRWDAFGRPRLQIWAVSSLAQALGLVAMLASVLLELHWRHMVLVTIWFTTDLILTPTGRSVLISVLLIGAWLADRHFELVTALDRKPTGWLRALRFLILTIPWLGIVASLALYRFTQETPSLWRKVQTPSPLIPENPYRLRSRKLSLRFDHLLHAAFQHLWVFSLWLAIFQVLPYFAALDLLGWKARISPFVHSVTGILCVILRAVALGAFLIFVKERQREVQMKRNEAVATGVALLATLAPFPISPIAMLVVLSLDRTKSFAHERTSLVTLYKTRFRSRALKNVTPTAFVTEEISGDEEIRRRRFYTMKTLLLALEVTALVWLLAPPLSDSSWKWLTTLSFCAALPGLLVWALKFSGYLLARGPGLSIPAALQDCIFLIVIPFVVVPAIIVGSLAGLEDRANLSGFFETLTYMGTLITLLVGTLYTLPTLLTRAPEPPFSGVALGMAVSCSFPILGGLLGNPRLGPPIFLMGRDLCVPILFASPLVGLAFGHWLLHPFGIRQLFDRSLPGRVRAVLACFAVPAILPLGGLAVLIWSLLRYTLGTKLDWQAARLRG